MTDPGFSGEIKPKKRRLPGACDECRSKKLKCDSAAKPDGLCSFCIKHSLKCAHNIPVKKRGPKIGASTSVYIQALEKRVETLEARLQELNITDIHTQASNSGTSTAFEKLTASSSRDDSPPFSAHGLHSSSNSTPRISESQVDDSEINADEPLFTRSDRFFGASSSFSLAHNALNMQSPSGHVDTRAAASKLYVNDWELHPWERVTLENERRRYNFPPSDLIDHLVAVFFGRAELFAPFVHKRSFIEGLQSGRHFTDTLFGAVVLAVLANGARYSHDPRVFADGTNELSAGWQWFEQVSDVRHGMFYGPTLLDLQLCALIVTYVGGSSASQMAWTMVGVGIRFAVEIGIHRRKPYGHKLTIDDELKRRAFWALLSFDRRISLFSGRPSILRDEDFDLELPVECDQEYWVESPAGELTFHQPPDIPARAAFLIHELKLIDILSTVSRTIYSIKKSKVMSGIVGNDWEQQMVSELDSALNNWKDQLPEHLRWNPHCEDRASFYEAAALIELFYITQIQLHRPFIHSNSPLSFSSLAVCTNAARACCHVLEVHTAKSDINNPYCVLGSFMCGIVLSMNIWSGKRSGLALNLKSAVSDVQKCLDVLKAASVRWKVAGRMWDMLSGIASLGNVPLSGTDAVSLKRSREVADLPEFTTITTDTTAPFYGQYSQDQFDGSQQSSLEDIFNEDMTRHPIDLDFAPLGNETLDIWSAAPTGFSWEEWGNFFSQAEVPTFDSTNIYQ